MESAAPERLSEPIIPGTGSLLRLWKAIERRKRAQGKEFTVVLQRRLASIELYDAYKEAVSNIQLAIREKRFRSTHGRKESRSSS